MRCKDVAGAEKGNSINNKQRLIIAGKEKHREQSYLRKNGTTGRTIFTPATFPAREFNTFSVLLSAKLHLLPLQQNIRVISLPGNTQGSHNNFLKTFNFGNKSNINNCLSCYLDLCLTYPMNENTGPHSDQCAGNSISRLHRK